jgi:hypothetical protein
MSVFNAATLRSTIASLKTDHDAAGEMTPEVGEVFAPRQHAAALAPSTLVVVGARGAGKSFWAGVLGKDETRRLASQVYPAVGLDSLIVKFGYMGFAANAAVSRQTIDSRVQDGDHNTAVVFWQAVILRAAMQAVADPRGDMLLGSLMAQFNDPELFEREYLAIDQMLSAREQSALVIFDALDTLSNNWSRLTSLTDALFEAVWSLRAYKNIKAKIFIRPDQLNDEGLKFVELPKLRSGRVELIWTRKDLYGCLYSRIFEAEQQAGASDFEHLALSESAPVPKSNSDRLRNWDLITREDRQKKVMERLSGLYMGNGSNKGATFPWTYNHLADARGVVTPRSFLRLFAEAALSTQDNAMLTLTPDAIRHGLRQASKTRVEQLALEYAWIKRALAPLAGLKVPCPRGDIHALWKASNTVGTIAKAAKDEGFLPPYRHHDDSQGEQALELALERIGVLSYRPDGRADIPDLFRIAAKMFKLGGVALHERKKK